MTDEATLQAAMVDVFDHLGTDAVFQPIDGDPIPCKVNLTRETSAEPDGFNVQTVGEQIFIEALISVIGKIPIAKRPNAEGEKFTVSGVVYEVVGISESDDYFVTSSVKIIL